MGSPKERAGQLTEKRVEVSLGNGEIVIPFHFGRQPVTSEAMRARLERYLIVGTKIANPKLLEETEYWKGTDQEILEELAVIARHPEERAPLMTLGLVTSPEGLGNYDKPFKSLGDPNLREVFRAIADPLVSEQFYNPAQITRGAMFRSSIVYPDGKNRMWDSGEVMSHLTIALAERGRVFDTKYDEHATRISAEFRWPADLAEMLGISYLLGEGKIEDNIRERVTGIMRENLDRVTHLADLSEEDQVQIATKANGLAGSKMLA